MTFYLAQDGEIAGPTDESKLVEGLQAGWIHERSKIAPGPNGPWKPITSHEAFAKALFLRPKFVPPPPVHTYPAAYVPRPGDFDFSGWVMLIGIPIVTFGFRLLVPTMETSFELVVLSLVLFIGAGIFTVSEGKRYGVSPIFISFLNFICGLGRLYYFSIRQRAGMRVGLWHCFFSDSLLMGVVIWPFAFRAINDELDMLIGVITLFFSILMTMLFQLPFLLIVAYMTKVPLTVGPIVRSIGFFIAVLLTDVPVAADTQAPKRHSLIPIFLRPWIAACAFAYCFGSRNDTAAVILAILTAVLLIAVFVARFVNIRNAFNALPDGRATIRRLRTSSLRNYAVYAFLTLCIVAFGAVMRFSNSQVQPPKPFSSTATSAKFLTNRYGNC